MLPAHSQDDNDPNAQLGQAIGNILGQALSNAIKQSAVRSWQKLDPAVLDCLQSQYGIDPAQLADQGISSGSLKYKGYVKECERLTAPPPMQIEGFADNPEGTYTRVAQGLPTIGSKFAVRVAASAVGNKTREARFDGLQRKVQAECPGQYSIAAIHFYGGNGDANSKANSMREPWADAEVECESAPADASDDADAIALEDLTANAPGAEYFPVRTAVVNASFKDTFSAAERVLGKRDARVARSDKDKGIIIAGEVDGRSAAYGERYFIMLDPETDTSTRLTFKLIAGSSEPLQGAAPFFHPDDCDVAAERARQFVSDVEQKAR